MGRVLIVDDNGDVRKSLAALFKLEGHEALTASNGREAVEQLQAGAPPHLVVLDLMMPTLDGLSFLEMLRKNPAWANLRVIIYTGYDQGVDTNRLRDLGVGEIMLKGTVDVERIVKAINC